MRRATAAGAASGSRGRRRDADDRSPVRRRSCLHSPRSRLRSGGAQASSRILIYGASLIVSAASLVASLAHLLAAAPPETVALPLGIPWLGAHFRLDALSAFFLVVIDLGALGGACSRSAMGGTSRAGAGAAVLSGVPCRHDVRCAGRRRLQLSARRGSSCRSLPGRW